MNWDAIGAVGEIAGGLVVIVSILYLARQIKENSRIAKAESQRTLLDTAHIWSNLVTTPGLISEFRQGIQNYDGLDQDAQGRFNFVMYPLLNHVESAYRMHRQGLLEDDSYIGWIQAFSGLVREPGAAVWWSHVKAAVGADFVGVIDNMVAKEDGVKLSDAWKFLSPDSNLAD